MNHIDLNYCGILSTRLNLFKIKTGNPYKANFRCPICGDSEKSKFKTRGWLLENNNTAFFNCFNCGARMHLSMFIKSVDLGLYNSYIVDHKLNKLDEDKLYKSPIEDIKKPVPAFKKIGSPLLKIKCVSSLSTDHPVRSYVNKRLIPVNQHYRLYFAPKFNSWINSIIPKKLSDKFDEPRLVIPLLDKFGNIYGVSGRSFDPKSTLRYITIMFNEDKPKMFGLDLVNFKKTYYILEGPIDSLFIPNSIAMVGADSNIDALENKENAIFIFDNESRNLQIVQRMEKLIQSGYNVCIWDKNILEKDVNDMVLSGRTSESILESINKNTYSGLMAKLKLSEWRNV